MIASDMEAAVMQMQRVIRQANTVIILLALASYALAIYLWHAQQNLPAVVLATMGFVLFRSMRTIAFRWAESQLAEQAEFKTLFTQLDPASAQLDVARIMARLETLSKTPQEDE